ncbi:MAG: FtsH protease activity modulator HflK [Acidiferrobacterales bacterium]|nr:FtsH protease activity modulator HflK [Acidiferrobacterales bacterium]
MPWDDSDPGNRKPKDRRGGRSEPPDLDEIVSDFRNSVSRLFGGLGKSGSGGSGDSSGDSHGTGTPARKPRGRQFIITLVAAIAFVVWVTSGLYVVEQGEQGVELRFGKYTQTTGAGLRWHMPMPIEEVLIVNVQKVNTVEVGYRVNEQNRQLNPVTREALMLTADENIIDIQFAVQYDIKDPKDLLFNVSDPLHLVVRQATESAVREIVGGNSMDFAITEGRAEIAQGTKVLLQEILDRYKTGVNIRAVEMQNAQPPAEVKAAFDDAVKAREDEERLKNEAEAYYNDVIPRARGQAARLLQEADAYKESIIARAEGEASRFEQIFEEYEKAPQITRVRLYLESLEQVLNNSTKLLIDQTNGNNIIYLPLDQIIQRQQDRDGNSSRSGSASNPGSTSNFVESSNRGTGRSGRIQG